jgi:hypothetical protein
MSSHDDTIHEFANRDYEWGWVTDIEADSLPPGLNEERAQVGVRRVSADRLPGLELLLGAEVGRGRPEESR